MKERKQLLGIFLIISALFNVQSHKAQNKKDTNDYFGIRKHWEVMNHSKTNAVKVFNEDKYGMFIHFGLYSQLAGEYQGKKIEEGSGAHIAEWIQFALEIPRKDYAAVAKDFNPSKFCAERIVQLAKNSGMKYLVITAKHHDGFALYDSECSQYDIMDATPYKKDIVKDLYEACNRHGIHFGIYYSHNLDWADGSDCGRKELLAMKNDNPEDISKIYGSNFWDPSPNTFEEYLNNKAYPQVKELLTKYPNMVQLWYDMPHYVTQQQSYNFYKIAYDLQPQMLINSRVGNDFGDFEVAGDNKVFDKAKETPWQTVGTLNNSWGYKWYDNDWKSPKEVLLWLIEIVSKGGNYMLNIGPKGSGEVPEESVKTLLKVGEWMHVNGEAIYGSKAWTVNHEGPTVIQMNGTLAREKEGFNKKMTSNDFWFTQKDGNVYVIALESASKVLIKSLSTAVGTIKNVKLLGYNRELNWKQYRNGLKVTLPKSNKHELGYALMVEFD